MTTSTFSEAPDMTSDATFRVWGLAISTNLAVVDLIQTADTGQIDWATVTLAATGTAAGYEIWRFDDALQSTKPVFMKIEYGTGNLSNIPSVWLTVGTGSDGAGALTGPTTTRITIGFLNSGGSAASKTCAMAYNGGSFAFLGFQDSVSSVNPQMFMAVSRTYTNAGAYDGDGVQTYVLAESSSPMKTQPLNFTSGVAREVDIYGNYSFIPGANSTGTAVSGDPQVYAHFASLPSTKIVPGMVTVCASDIAVNTTFTAAVAGATARTYLRMPYLIGTANNNATTSAAAMIFE